MTFISSAQNFARYTGKDWRSHLLPIFLAGAIAVVALALVMGRPRMEAEVADAGDLPRGAGFFVSLFFAVTKLK